MDFYESIIDKLQQLHQKTLHLTEHATETQNTLDGIKQRLNDLEANVLPCFDPPFSSLLFYFKIHEYLVTIFTDENWTHVQKSFKFTDLEMARKTYLKYLDKKRVFLFDKYGAMHFVNNVIGTTPKPDKFVYLLNPGKVSNIKSERETDSFIVEIVPESIPNSPNSFVRIESPFENSHLDLEGRMSSLSE